jgi:hypothetical protein
MTSAQAATSSARSMQLEFESSNVFKIVTYGQTPRGQSHLITEFCSGGLWTRDPSLRVPEKGMSFCRSARGLPTPSTSSRSDLQPRPQTRKHIHGWQNPWSATTATRKNVLTAANILAGGFNSAGNQLTQVIFRPQSARGLPPLSPDSRCAVLVGGS